MVPVFSEDGEQSGHFRKKVLNSHIGKVAISKEPMMLPLKSTYLRIPL